MPSIVFLAASPTDQPQLRLAREVHLVTLQKTLLQAEDTEIIPLLDIASWELPTVLDRLQPDILHFSGHGIEDALAVAGRNNATELVDHSDLRLLFSVLSRKKPACIFLNACYSQSVAITLRRLSDVVIGMPDEVDDEAAVAFSQGFYETLMLGQSLEMALGMGRVRARALTGRVVSPVVSCAEGVDPGETYLTRRPRLLARVLVNRDGSLRLANGGEHAWVDILLVDAPKDITEVIFDVPNEDWGSDDGDQLHKSRAGTEGLFFSDDLRVWGNISIRASLWGAKRGLGVLAKLNDALAAYYADRPQDLSEDVQEVLRMLKGDDAAKARLVQRFGSRTKPSAKASPRNRPGKLRGAPRALKPASKSAKSAKHAKKSARS